MSEINIGACTCPGTPHPDGDLLEMRDKLGLAGGSVLTSIALDYIQTPMVQRHPVANLIADLRVAYVEQGAIGWNLLGEDGEPLPFTPDNLKAQVLEDYSRGVAAADAGDQMYYGAVLAPLLAEVQKLSQPTPAKPKTSATRSSPKKTSRLRSIPGSQTPPTTSKPSLTTTSQTAYIERTSVGLVSASNS